jgi:hypothetical protein
MLLTPRQRVRLAEIARQKGGARALPFKNDAVGRTLVRRGLVDVALMDAAAGERNAAAPALGCWLTEDGRRALRDDGS